MAGRGPEPSHRRLRTPEPERGDWTPTPGVGWQHDAVPPCPVRGAAAAATWSGWMGSWFAAHWSPEDLPNLRLLIKLWTKADSGKVTGAERSEYRQLADSYGVTPKGQQDRRWKRPEIAATTPDAMPSPYAELRAVK
jgi:hypothetical protein